jgi:hypothetical protein
VKQCGRFHLPSNGNNFRVRVRVSRQAGVRGVVLLESREYDHRACA